VRVYTVYKFINQVSQQVKEVTQVVTQVKGDQDNQEINLESLYVDQYDEG